MAKKSAVLTGIVSLGVASLITLGLFEWVQGSNRPRTPEVVEAQEVGPLATIDEAGRLANQLKRHPTPPSTRQQRQGLYLIEADRNDATLIVDEPTPGLSHCGSARWSRDGTRILFDATPGSQWNQAHIFAIEAGETRPRIVDLGPGNCPSPSPDGKQVAFVLNPGAVPGAERGLWIMNGDGSGRKRMLSTIGRPYWSPDARKILVVSFSDPCRLSLLDVETKTTIPIQIDGHKVESIPSWASENTLVAVLNAGQGRLIALVDVTDPAQGQIKVVLREHDGKPTVTPSHPVYSNSSRRCFFVNANPKGMSLYSIEQGIASRPKRLERDGFDHAIADIAASPDGRYLLFCSDRTVTKSP